MEGAFGSIINIRVFAWFLMRGVHNVMTEFLILALAFNIQKLHNRIQGQKLALHLHPLEASEAV